MSLYSWGSNSHGQLGHGPGLSGVDSHAPTPILFSPPLATSSFSSCLAACGANHSLVCLDARSLYACGLNEQGQLGTGDTQARSTMTRIYLSCFPDGSDYKILGLACGWDYSLLLVESNAERYLVGFGSNELSTLLVADARLLAPTILLKDSRLDKVAAGVRHVLATDSSDTRLWSWGDDRYGKLGPRPKHATPPRPARLQPELDHYLVDRSFWAEAAGDRIISFCASHQFSAILTASRRLLIFGKWSAASPSAVSEIRLDDPALPPMTALFANWGSIVVFSRMLGKLYGLGKNRYGQLGAIKTSGQAQRSALLCELPIGSVRAVSAGSEHLLALSQIQQATASQPASAALVAWGWNEHGQLGLAPSSLHHDATAPHVLCKDMASRPGTALFSGYSHNIVHVPAD